MSEPTTASRHSEQCWAIGSGPGHEVCVCVCHGTMAARAVLLDDPDWHAAACAYDAGSQACDCLLPERIRAIEAEARAPLREALDGCQRTLESIVRGGAQPKGQLTLIVATLQVIRVALADTAEAER